MNGGFTTSFLGELLPLFLTQRGLDVEIRESAYGAFQMDILDDTSSFWTFDPNVVVLAPTHRDLQHTPPALADGAMIDNAVTQELAAWQTIWRKIDVPIIQFTYDPPPTRALGDADGLYPGGLLHYVRKVNTALVDRAPAHVTFIDGERLAADLGSDWYDERLYRLAKQPFAMDALPVITNAIAANVAGVLGLSRKVLILDLDNTLWGGVIGDDGIAGIALGPETAEGESFVAFQHYVKSLSDRGIVLCVCSKNDPEIAREPFTQHGAMHLTLDDIADFRANFDDKAANIRAISKTLNLGLDSFVFVDDSPVECAIVRENLPEVWTIELSGDPADFARRLDRVNAFPAGRITQEDRRRADSYRSLGKVQSGIEEATDIDGFLRNLNPTAVIEAVRDDTVERISQLIGKTNQFKLNTSIFSAAELRARADDVLAIRLTDKLQDYGIVAVAVTEPDPKQEALVICNWVMSCRVFSRRLEFLTRELLAERARNSAMSHLCLNYVDSGRNTLIAELLPKLGFTPDGPEDWYMARTTPPDDLPPHFISY